MTARGRCGEVTPRIAATLSGLHPVPARKRCATCACRCFVVCARRTLRHRVPVPLRCCPPAFEIILWPVDEELSPPRPHARTFLLGQAQELQLYTDLANLRYQGISNRGYSRFTPTASEVNEVRGGRLSVRHRSEAL